MFKIKLVADSYERWLTGLQYEYFCPVKMKDDYYTKFLYKNFPYEMNDPFSLALYHKHGLPTVKPSVKDEKLQREAYRKSEGSRAFVSGLRTSFSQKPETSKDIYYNELALMRQAAGLDYGIAPNYNYKYDNYLRPVQDICAKTEFNKVGGIFNLRLESSSNDDFLYEWMISGQMKNGRIVFYDGDGDQAFKIEFWDCYCFSIAEQMNSIGNSAMTMNLRLSPAITRNRSVEHQKVWKVTDISRTNKAFGGGPVVVEKKEGRLTKCYFEDSDGYVINKLRRDMDIYAVIDSSNMIGKTISIDLSDDEVDYEYKGQYLENDLLEDIKVTADTIKIPLKTLKQRS